MNPSISKLVLDFKDNKWKFKEYTPFVSLLLPYSNFSKTSKKPTYENTRIEQISNNIKYVKILHDWSDPDFTFPTQSYLVSTPSWSEPLQTIPLWDGSENLLNEDCWHLYRNSDWDERKRVWEWKGRNSR